MRDRNAAHATERNERERRRYQEKRDQIALVGRAYRFANRGRYKAITRQRRQKIALSGEHYTGAEWESLRARYGHRCLACGQSCVPLQADHVVPVSRGGSDGIDNIQPLCKPCNLRKATRSTDYRPGV
jgi:5-methylcytosine-specific restriction endonuclease McrA